MHKIKNTFFKRKRSILVTQFLDTYKEEGTFNQRDEEPWENGHF